MLNLDSLILIKKKIKPKGTGLCVRLISSKSNL